ncbi:MAG TPA: sugar ABC transporter permease, partial [Clostridia bacterium]|nr:sugar ABC transporter permease [Clostridia bacterium]
MNHTAMRGVAARRPASSRLRALASDIRFNRYAYLLTLPVIVYYILFHYMPMYGVVIAFKNFSPGLGIWNSPWAGLQHFRMFFSSDYAWRTIRNTFLISAYSIAFGFP